MIQRIQTLYLALGVVAMGAAFLMSDLAAALDAAAMGRLAGLAIAGVTALVAIFLYSRRPLQRKWVVAAQFVALVAIAGTFYVQYQTDSLIGVNTLDPSTVASTVFPAAGYVLFWLGRRAIDRDIALIRSMDRLR